MKSNFYGNFNEDDHIPTGIEIYFYCRYFFFIVCLDILFPFLYDPFSLKGDYYLLSRSSLDIDDLFFIFIFFVFTGYIIYFYRTESLLAYLQVVFFYIFCFEWVFDIIYFFIIEDFIYLIIGLLLIIEFYFPYYDDEDDDEDI